MQHGTFRATIFPAKVILLAYLLTTDLSAFEDIDSDMKRAAGNQIAACEAKGIYVPKTEILRCGSELPIFRWVCRNGSVEKEPLGESTGNTQCSNPTHINSGPSGCYPGGFDIFKSPVNASFCIALCRRKSAAKADISEVAMICHNPDGGGTCFFNTVGNVNMDHLPPVGQGRPWGYVGPNACMKCHDNDPLIFTPFSAPIFEALKAHNISVPFGQYYGVQANGDSSGSHPRTAFSLDESLSCTECHRLGGPYTCGTLAQLSTGHATHGSKAAAPEGCGKASAAFRWMPPADKPLSPVEERALQKDISRVKECCEDIDEYSYTPKSNTKCQWKEIPFDSADRPLASVPPRRNNRRRHGIRREVTPHQPHGP